MTPKSTQSPQKSWPRLLLETGFEIGTSLYIPLLLTVYIPPEQINSLLVKVSPEIQRIEKIELHSPLFNFSVKFAPTEV